MKLSLVWKGGLRFANGAAGPPIELDSAAAGVVSPVQALGYALTACMAMDVAHALEKGRHRVEAMDVAFDASRAQKHPRRLETVHLHFDISGDVPEAAVERAIDLSRTTYCSVWASLRQDIQLTVTFTVRPQADAPVISTS